MKFLFKLILVIMVVLIFIFVFAGQGIFDGFLPLMEAKGMVVTLFKGGVFDMGGDEYMVKKSQADQFVAHMLNAGYKLTEMGDDWYTFEYEGKNYRFERREILRFFYVFEAE